MRHYWWDSWVAAIAISVVATLLLLVFVLSALWSIARG